MNIYGILDKNNCHVDICRTEIGAKRFATKNGYNKVSIRYNCGYVCEVVAKKVNNKWINQ